MYFEVILLGTLNFMTILFSCWVGLFIIRIYGSTMPLGLKFYVVWLEYGNTDHLLISISLAHICPSLSISLCFVYIS